MTVISFNGFKQSLKRESEYRWVNLLFLFRAFDQLSTFFSYASFTYIAFIGDEIKVIKREMKYRIILNKSSLGTVFAMRS